MWYLIVSIPDLCNLTYSVSFWCQGFGTLFLEHFWYKIKALIINITSSSDPKAQFGELLALYPRLMSVRQHFQIQFSKTIQLKHGKPNFMWSHQRSMEHDPRHMMKSFQISSLGPKVQYPGVWLCSCSGDRS